MDIYYVILVVPALIFAFWAQAKVNGASRKYSRIPNSQHMSGADAARMILDANGLYNVGIEHISGDLTDHYDPKANVIRLSDTTCDKVSITAIGVAAHEAGHAVQHAVGYGPIKLRMAILPVCSIGSNLAMPLFLLGLLFSYAPLMDAGIIFFALAAFFQLVTLPVEFNASSRALAALTQRGCFSRDELYGVKQVLSAAALTYVAALAVALANLLRLIAIANRRK